MFLFFSFTLLSNTLSIPLIFLDCKCKKDGAWRNSEGSGRLCDEKTGECVCVHGIEGEQCERCPYGRFNHPKCWGNCITPLLVCWMCN